MAKQLRVIKGDLLTLENGIIVHQLNAIKIGAGIAYSLAMKYPKHLSDYNNQTRFKTLEEKMGMCVETITPIPGKTLSIIGIIAQESYGNGRKTGINYTNYESLEKGFEYISKNYKGQIYMPLYIGADLAGGDHKRILKLIHKHLPEAILVDYVKGKKIS